MEKLKQYKYIIAIVLVILGFAFYWYEYRPTQIKERCSTEARMGLRILAENDDNVRQGTINRNYNDCLMRFGLK